MIRPLDVRPTQPKNGDKWRDSDEVTKEFRFGRWMELVPKDDVLGLEKKNYT